MRTFLSKLTRGTNQFKTTTARKINETTHVEAQTIGLTSHGANIIQGDTIHVHGISTSSALAIKLESTFATFKHSNIVLETPVISSISQPLKLNLQPDQTAAFRIDTQTLVVDSTNTRVGVNKLEPQATLHVGGDAIFDDELNLTGDLDITNTNTSISSSKPIVI